MDIKVLQEELSKAISICSRFSSSKVQLPVLANICFDATKNKLRISATNLEISVSVSLGAKTDGEGSVTVPAKIISEIISNLKPGQIQLKSEKEILEIVSAEFESKISGINAVDFPKVPSEVGVGGVKIPLSKLENSINKVLFSVSSDETRPVLTGVLVIMRKDEIVLVSTDGFRLSHVKIEVNNVSDEEKRLIIPRGILSELVRVHEDADIEFLHKKSENQVVFGGRNIVMSSRVIDGDFPDFEKIIPKTTKIKVSVDREELLRGIKLASVFAKDSSNVIKIGIKKDIVEILSESQQHGSQKGRVDAKIDGFDNGEFLIAFNYRFLEEFLNACDGDNIQMEFSDPNSPSLFLDTKDTKFFHIIMPVRLQS